MSLNLAKTGTNCESRVNDESHDDPREKQDDEFAAETLIPKRYHHLIRNLKSKQETILLAAELGIAPGIVVGRDYHLTGRWNRFNDLIRKLQWNS